MPGVQANARLLEAYRNLGEAYVDLAVNTADLVSTKLRFFSINYDLAYGNYSRVIEAGRREAQNQTLWRGIFLGIATGVVAGVAAAYIAPSTAAGWFTLTLADAGAAAGSSALQTVASTAIAYALSDAMTVRGSDMQPSGMSPDVLRSNIWRHTAEMYRGAFNLTRGLRSMNRDVITLERFIAEMRVHAAGGASRYNAEDVLRGANAIPAFMTRRQPQLEALQASVSRLQQFSTTVRAWDHNRPTADQMQDDIWVLWIGSLSEDDSDILDLDAIEDHLHARRILGPSSRLGVDFGGYTSEDDELAAIRAARPHAANIRTRYQQAATQWNLPG